MRSPSTRLDCSTWAPASQAINNIVISFLCENLATVHDLRSSEDPLSSRSHPDSMDAICSSQFSSSLLTHHASPNVSPIQTVAMITVSPICPRSIDVATFAHCSRLNKFLLTNTMIILFSVKLRSYGKTSLFSPSCLV